MRAGVWRRAAVAVAVLVGFVLPRPAAAAADPSAPDVAAVERFFDEHMLDRVARMNVPGAVVVYVQDGRIAFARGYGLADVENRRPMDPDRTLLPVGSISKLVTATAVLQLVEQGKIDLAADVNAYAAPLRIEDRPGERAVTVADVLRHTEGFEPRYVGIAARTEAEILPAEQFLTRYPPRRTLPAGRLATYSSGGYMLAGLIVERVGGLPFPDYARRHVLDPLGMDRSGFAPDIVGPPADRAAGYMPRHGRRERLVPYFVHGPSTGGLIAPAADVARFMLMQLNGGRLGDAVVLRPQTLRLMHETQFTSHAGATGWTYGFSEYRRNGERGLEHGGYWPGFMSKLFLLPARNVGFFVAYNLHEPTLITGPVAEFVDRFYPAAAGTAAAATGAGAMDSAGRPIAADDLTGEYQPAAASRSTFEKLYTLLTPQRVTATAGGAIVIAAAGEPPRTLPPSGPRTFGPAGTAAAVFETDARGRVDMMFCGGAAFTRVPWYASASLHVKLFAGFAAAFTAACVAVGVCATSTVVRPRLGLRPVGRLHGCDWLAGGGAMLHLASLAGTGAALKLTDHMQFTYGIPPAMRAVLLIPFATAAVAAALTVVNARLWMIGGASPWLRLRGTAFAVALWAFFPMILYWNLIGIGG
ncbi:MAG TPA: serine hydrolase domain-containing protein [Tepidisphaeraceae bacterium]|nr:serine hydrolase domain-containing protein [Tepidisphaeraceae bacterium]